MAAATDTFGLRSSGRRPRLPSITPKSVGIAAEIARIPPFQSAIAIRKRSEPCLTIQRSCSPCEKN